MAENDANTGAQVTPQAGAAASMDASGMIPKPRFDEVNQRMKAAEATLLELRRSTEERERADLEAKGQYEKLKATYEGEIGSLRTKAEQWDTYQTSRRETLLSGLQDEDKPLADGLPLDKLEALVSRLTKQTAPPVVPTPPGVPGATQVAGKLTPKEIEEGVKKHGAVFLRENFTRL